PALPASPPGRRPPGGPDPSGPFRAWPDCMRKRRFSRSFGAEGSDGIDARGAERRDRAGEKGRERHEHGGDAERRRIVRVDAEEEPRDEPAESQRGRRPEEDADPDGKHRLAEDETENPAAPGAERDPDADLPGALGDGEG